MRARTRAFSAACAAVVAVLLMAAPAMAESLVSVQVPASIGVGKTVDVTYTGMADEPGTSELTGTGPNMMMRAYYEANASSCSPTSAQQQARRGATRDGATYIESPAAFSFTSNILFENRGAYRFCVYLEVGQTSQSAPPAAFAQAVLQVGPPPKPCSVPRLTGFTLTSAKKKLSAAGCSLGKVKKPKSSKGKKLVVGSQSQPAQRQLTHAAKVNLVLKVKKAKKR